MNNMRQFKGGDHLIEVMIEASSVCKLQKHAKQMTTQPCVHDLDLTTIGMGAHLPALQTATKGHFICSNCHAWLFSSLSLLSPRVVPAAASSSTATPPHSDDEISDATIDFSTCIEGAVQMSDSHAYGLERIACVCSKCGLHLGFLYDSSTRYCVLRLSLDFIPEEPYTGDLTVDVTPFFTPAVPSPSASPEKTSSFMTKAAAVTAFTLPMLLSALELVKKLRK